MESEQPEPGGSGVKVGLQTWKVNSSIDLDAAAAAASITASSCRQAPSCGLVVRGQA